MDSGVGHAVDPPAASRFAVVLGDSDPDSDTVPDPVRRRGRGHASASPSGHFWCWIVAQGAARHMALAPDIVGAYDASMLLGAGWFLVAFVQVVWGLFPVDDPIAVADFQSTGRRLPERTRGFLSYKVMQRQTIVPAVRIDGDGHFRTKASKRAVTRAVADCILQPAGIAVREFVKSVNRVTAYAFPLVEALEIAQGSRLVLRSTALHMCHRNCLLGGIPTARVVQGWCRRQRATAEPPEQPEDDMDLSVPNIHSKRRDDAENENVPKRLRKTFEGETVVRALKFQRKIRDTEEFDSSLQAASEYLDYMRGTKEEDFFDVSTFENPSARTLRRGILQLDATCCLLERREWAEIVKAPSKLVSLHLFADGSPVTGYELQGMLVDFCFADGRIERRCLVAAALSYGRCSALDKLLAFLWAGWLMAGPSETSFLLFLSFFASATTDLGTESHMLDLPDISRCFFAMLCGMSLDAAALKIDRMCSSLGHAMLLPGWSHMMSNMMKYACTLGKQWPENLNRIRALSRFYRNGTWREFLAQRFPNQECTAPLEKTTWISFAKWRYATVPAAMKGLLRVRTLTQDKLESSLFIDTQEKELIKEVLEASNAAGFWRWMQAMWYYVLMPLEHLRRWSMVSDCCAAARRLNRNHTCKRNGRRLGTALGRVERAIKYFRETARDLKQEDVENDKPLCIEIMFICRALVEMLKTKFAWLWQLPYYFIHCLTVPGATRCLELLDEFPHEQHTCTSQWWNTHLRGDLESVKAGNEPSQKLRLEHSRMENSSLDETPGEGWHRGTTHDHTRAARATREHLIACQRQKQNTAMFLKVLRKHKDRGKRVLEFEWRNFKRVLNKPLSQRRIFQRVRMKDRPFYRKFYRLDEGIAAEDIIIERVPLYYLV